MYKLIVGMSAMALMLYLMSAWSKSDTIKDFIRNVLNDGPRFLEVLLIMLIALIAAVQLAESVGELL